MDVCHKAIFCLSESQVMVFVSYLWKMCFVDLYDVCFKFFSVSSYLVALLVMSDKATPDVPGCLHLHNAEQACRQKQ